MADREASMTINRQQNGSALILGLVLLMMLTMIVLSSMRSGVMQDRMISAQLDSNAAYEGAEHALREAETYLRTQPYANLPTLFTADTSGRYSMTSNAFPTGNSFFDNSTWTGTKSVQVGKPTVDSKALVAEQPQYMIQHMGEVTATGSGSTSMPLNMGNHTNNIASGSGKGQMFRIVARSTGRSGDSPRVLEQYFLRGQE